MMEGPGSRTARTGAAPSPLGTRGILAVAGGTLPTLLWTLRLAYRESPLKVVGIAATTLLRGALPAAFALAVKELLDTGLGTAPGTTVWSDVAPWLLAAAALAIAEAVLEVGSTRLNGELRLDMTVALRARFVQQATRLDVAFFDRPAGQDQLARAEQASQKYVGRVLRDLADTTTALFQGASLAAVMVLIEPFTAALLALALPVYLLFELHLANYRYRFRSAWVTMDRWSGYYLSRMTRMPAVAESQLLGLGPEHSARFRQILHRYREAEGDLLRQQFRGSALFLGATTAGAFGLLARVCVRVLGGSATVGDVSVYALSIARLRNVLDRGARTGSRLLENLLMVGDLRDFLEAPARDPDAGADPGACEGRLSVERVSFAYPDADAPVLHELSFEIEPGETVAIVGENGSGKSTLVYLLAGLYTPQSGVVRLDGRDTAEMAPEALRRQIAFVFQRFNKYEASAADNVAFGNWAELERDRARTEEIARAAGADAFVARMPDGYDTKLGRLFGTHELSGGQWQLLAISRAFARDAPVLILDEPAANLDARAEHAFFERARKAAEGRTTVLITHRVSTVRMADRILVLDGGRIVEEGTHDDLLAAGGRYAELHALSIRGGQI